MIAMIPPIRPNLIRGPAAVCLAFLCAFGGLVSCVVQHTERVPPDAGPRAVTLLDAWDVDLDDERVGRVSLIRIEDPERPQTFYKIEYADGQHAGWVDLSGRAWRREPFRAGLVLIGTDPMAENVRRLLDLTRRPQLRHVSPAASDTGLSTRVE